jgi:hypothetical protein
MSKPRKGKPSKPLTYEQAAAELPRAEAALTVESTAYSEAYEQCILQLRALHAIMAGERAKTLAARKRVDDLRAMVDRGEGKPVPVFKLVPNPMITQGLLDAVAEGEVQTQHQAGQMAAINQTLLVGGLARVKSKSEAQLLAAARYCHLYEVAQIGPTRATDYTQVRVDTSGPRQDPVTFSQDAQRAELAGARVALGARAASIVDQIVVYGISVRQLAEKLRMGQGGQARRRLERELLDGLDVLVGHFRLLPDDKPKPRLWTDGSKVRVARDEKG